MLGTYDFCAHYEWTFAWLERERGPDLVRKYWVDAISNDSQLHARELIGKHGFQGMHDYWEHTLDEEAAGYTTTEGPGFYRTDMHSCPSKGFLIRNGLVQFGDYCDHCVGWIGPLMKDAGFRLEHEHNHKGQCWIEIRKADDPTPISAPGELAGEKDVRLGANWKSKKHDHFGTTLDERVESSGSSPD